MTDGSDCVYAGEGVGGAVGAVCEKERRAAVLQRCHSERKQVHNQQVFMTHAQEEALLHIYSV